MPRLTEVLKESLQSYLRRRLGELDRTRQSHKKERSGVGTHRGEKSGNVEAATIGVNQGERLPKIPTPTAQIEKLKTQPRPNTTSVQASLIDTRGVPLGKAGMIAEFTQPRIEPDVF